MYRYTSTIIICTYLVENATSISRPKPNNYIAERKKKFNGLRWSFPKLDRVKSPKISILAYIIFVLNQVASLRLATKIFFSHQRRLNGMIIIHLRVIQTDQYRKLSSDVIVIMESISLLALFHVHRQPIIHYFVASSMEGSDCIGNSKITN